MFAKGLFSKGYWAAGYWVAGPDEAPRYGMPVVMLSSPFASGRLVAPNAFLELEQ